MTVYIEYAFLQNFLLDGALLFLALRATRLPVSWARLFFAALLGGVFAVLFPLLRLSAILGTFLKLAVGLLLPLLAVGKLRGKNQRSRFFLCAALFFLFTFCFGGALLSGAQSLSLSRVSAGRVGIGFALLTAGSLLLIEKVYRRRGIFQHIYECLIVYGGKRVKTRGFLDSGNRATKNGIPVCFLSAELVYELFGQDILFEGEGRGQVCDELTISTLSGERRVPLYKGELRIKKSGEFQGVGEVYFALATNMIGREYKIILYSGLGEGL